MVERVQLAKEAPKGASVILNEVINTSITSSDTTISSLAPLPSARKNKRGADHGDIAKAALRRVEEGGNLL